MPQHVLLGASPPEILTAVQLGLESAGHVVRFASDVEGVVGAARSKSVDLVIVAEALSGGTGSDVCLILQDLPGGHAPLLYVGDLLVPGADAFVPESDPGRILEQAMAMLEGAELIDSLGDMQKPEAPAPAPLPPSPPPPPPAPTSAPMPWAKMPAPAPAAAKPAPAAPPEQPKTVADVSPEPVKPAAEPAPTPAPVPPPAAAKPAAADPEDPPKTRKTPARAPTNGAAPKDKAFFDALLKKVRESDYFEILGVTQDASEDDIRAAHEAIHASLAGIGTAVPRLQLEEAKDAVDEARDVLTEPALRAAYTRNRP